jgi:hypothetical protein
MINYHAFLCFFGRFLLKNAIYFNLNCPFLHRKDVIMDHYIHFIRHIYPIIVSYMQAFYLHHVLNLPECWWRFDKTNRAFDQR